MSKGDFNKVALQLYWNSFSAWVFSCKFADYIFRRNFPKSNTRGWFCNSFNKSMCAATSRTCFQIFELILTHVLSHFTLLALLAQRTDPSVALDLSTMRPFFCNKYLLLSNINWSDTVLMLDLSGGMDSLMVSQIFFDQ